eukprot:243808_1
MLYCSKDHYAHNKKYSEFVTYSDYDSDDEELEIVSKFFEVDGYSILKKWKLQQFYERMVDEGWANPLDWVHLDDYIMRQNLGFRPGHIQIFNRKFDLWVKKYNEVRRTIPPKQKGKDGTLIVGAGELKILKSNYNYEFTKVIVRKDGILTTEAWSPSKQNCGILFIKSYQEIVLEENAQISVNGKGCWGSKNPLLKGHGNGGGGSVNYSECGAGGAGHASKGKKGHTPHQFEHVHKDVSDFITSNDIVDDINCDQDTDVYHGYGGKSYGDETIACLDCIYDEDFDEEGKNATNEAVLKHREALGSGGGCYVSRMYGKSQTIRGGTGGGAVKIVCDKLIMYEGSVISANGCFNPNKHPLTSGGSGGCVWITVNKQIKVYNKTEDDNSNTLIFRLEALGGGLEFDELKYLKQMGGNAVGLGSCGRIRIDYHTPYNIQFDRFRPKQAFIGEGDDGKTGNGSHNPPPLVDTAENVFVHNKQYTIQCVKTQLFLGCANGKLCLGDMRTPFTLLNVENVEQAWKIQIDKQLWVIRETEQQIDKLMLVNVDDEKDGGIFEFVSRGDGRYRIDVKGKQNKNNEYLTVGKDDSGLIIQTMRKDEDVEEQLFWIHIFIENGVQEQAQE